MKILPTCNCTKSYQKWGFLRFLFSLFGLEEYKQNLSKMKEDTVPRGPERKGREYSVARCNGGWEPPIAFKCWLSFWGSWWFDKNWEFAKLKPFGTSMKKGTKHENIKTKLQSTTRLEYQTFWGQSTRQRPTKQCIKNGHCPPLLLLWCNTALLCHRSYFFCIKLHKILFCIKSILLQLDSPWREAEGPGLTVTLKVRHQRYYHPNYSPISTYPQIKITLKKP